VAAVVVLGFAALIWEIIATRPVRAAIRTYVQLVATADRTELTPSHRLDAARSLCTARYLSQGSLALGPEGGLVGLPRTVHKNFRAWREGDNVWICPMNRIGAVYQFVLEGGQWKFDGLVAYIPPRGPMIRTTNSAILEAP
jgi:hypothetical protein